MGEITVALARENHILRHWLEEANKSLKQVRSWGKHKEVASVDLLDSKLQAEFWDWAYGWDMELEPQIEKALGNTTELDEVSPTVHPGEHYDLSRREMQVLDMVRLGLTDQQIADRLEVARKTVHSHLSHAYAKLGVHTRIEAVRRIYGFGGGSSGDE